MVVQGRSEWVYTYSLVVIGLVNMANPDGCWHGHTFPAVKALPREGALAVLNVDTCMHDRNSNCCTLCLWQ